MYMKGKYINTFLRMRARSDILAIHPKVFHDAKEITESMAVYNALVYEMGLDPHNKEICCICPGDGKYAQTGILLAFLTKWEIISIDPMIAEDELEDAHVQRLTLIAEKVEDVKIHTDMQVVFAATHSHAPLKSLLENITTSSTVPRKMVNLPCCKPHNDEIAHAYFKYEDPYILSPKNVIYLWDESRNEPIRRTR